MRLSGPSLFRTDVTQPCAGMTGRGGFWLVSGASGLGERRVHRLGKMGEVQKARSVRSVILIDCLNLLLLSFIHFFPHLNI
jgi:hypothetical protein